MTNPLIWVLHGPNLNRLGLREPALYGSTRLTELNETLVTLGGKEGARVVAHQSNHEGELIDLVHRAPEASVGGFLINPAAFTHTSVALRDALLSVSLPFFEVHLTNIYRREPFRHPSYFSDLAQGVICGLGPEGYEAGLLALIRHLK